LSSDPLVGVVEISLKFFIRSTKIEYNQDNLKKYFYLTNILPIGDNELIWKKIF
jgi:hypothetical protein